MTIGKGIAIAAIALGGSWAAIQTQSPGIWCGVVVASVLVAFSPNN